MFFKKRMLQVSINLLYNESLQSFYIESRPSSSISIFKNITISLYDILNQTVSTNNGFIHVSLYGKYGNNSVGLRGEQKIFIKNGQVILNNTYIYTNFSNNVVYILIESDEIYSGSIINKFSSNEKIIDNKYSFILR